MNQDNNDLTKPIDKDRVERTRIMMEYAKKHPEEAQKTHEGVPSFEPSSKEEMELADLVAKIEKQSLSKKNGIKGMKKADIKKIATIIAASMAAVTFIGAPVGLIVEKAVNASVIDKQLEEAVSYMDQMVLPDVLQRAGFIITGQDDKGKTLYEFDRYAYIRAQDILMGEYGFDRHSAELLIAEALDSRLYPTGDSNEYYEKMGYRKEGPLYDSTAVFKNNNEVKVIYRVNDIKDEYQISTDSAPYVIDSAQVGGDEIGHARN